MKRLPYQPKMLAEAGHSIISKFNELADQLGLSRSLAEAAQTELSRLERAIAANWKASETGAHIAPALSRARQAAAKPLVQIKATLRQREGDTWTAVWGEAGFSRGTTRMPQNISGEVALLEAMAKFLTGHPDWEDQAGDFTATVLAARAANLLAIHQESSQFERQRNQLVQEVGVSGSELRDRLKLMVAAMQEVLKPGDPRWGGLELLPIKNPQEPKTQVIPNRPRVVRGPIPAAAEGPEVKLWQFAQQLADESITRADQARTAYQEAVATAERLRTEADQAQAEAERLLEKAEQLAPVPASRVTATTSTVPLAS